MAYDRYDRRDRPRDERSRWAEDRYDPRDRGTSHDRGFFERAGDPIFGLRNIQLLEQFRKLFAVFGELNSMR